MARRKTFLTAALVAVAACNQPDAAPADLLKKGMEFKNQGDYAHALEQFNLALAKTPEDPSLLNTRGTTYMIMGQYDSALKDLSKAIELRPDYALAIKTRGRVHFFLGHYAEATTDLRRGAELDPKNLYVSIWLDLALQRQGQDGAAALAAGMARADSTWPLPIAKYLSGKSTAQQLDSAAGASSAGASRVTLCTMFYVGEQALAQHDTTQARAQFTEAKTKCSPTATEFHAASGELIRLGGGKA